MRTSAEIIAAAGYGTLTLRLLAVLILLMGMFVAAFVALRVAQRRARTRSSRQVVGGSDATTSPQWLRGVLAEGPSTPRIDVPDLIDGQPPVLRPAPVTASVPPRPAAPPRTPTAGATPPPPAPPPQRRLPQNPPRPTAAERPGSTQPTSR